MKNVFIFIFISILVAFTIQEPKGKSRWDVKTLTDADAKKVNYVPKKASILQLSASTKPPVIGNNMPRTKLEFATFKVTCGIKKFIKEDDGDIHLVLYDLRDTNLTMVAEIPQKGFDSVVTQFNLYKLPKGKVQKGKYQIIGVGFYDKLHGSSGEALNGIEIHPVLGIKKLQ